MYQWLDKVYLAQVFNYGKRLQFDLMVPEPAALLLKIANGELPNQFEKPVAPESLDLSPLDLSLTPGPNFYGTLLKKFRVSEVPPPPAETITVATTISKAAVQNHDINSSETLKTDEGYAAETVDVTISYEKHGNPQGGAAPVVDVVVGKLNFQFPTANAQDDGALHVKDTVMGRLGHNQTDRIALPWGDLIRVGAIRTFRRLGHRHRSARFPISCPLPGQNLKPLGPSIRCNRTVFCIKKAFFNHVSACIKPFRDYCGPYLFVFV